MSGKQKRRHSDSDAEPKNANPFLTSEQKMQTAPANPFTTHTPPTTDTSNPFSSNTLTILRTSQKPQSSMSAQRISKPDDCKLRAQGFNKKEAGTLGQRIKRKVECSVRVYKEKGWAVLMFDSAQQASELLERGLRIDGEPDLTLSPYQRSDRKKNVFDRLEPKPPSSSITESPSPILALGPPSGPVFPAPAMLPQTVVHSSTLSDPRQGRVDTDREEKLFFMEQRDSQLREQIKTSREVVIGTCEDMCPEKERFWREERHCLSTYELLPGPGYAVDHTAAVKEFSRNAADKTQPLPHELRTEDALERTLLYLSHKVIPARPYSRDWYGYLSNRLEALRQDVTIQHLCSLRSARLLEACARYHALCSHLLLEADFEPSEMEMNVMKLRSILTPLLQMYRDLRPDGVRSPHEPEFVSFSLILAIETGLIAYDLLLLPVDVINTRPVQFVLQVWQAVRCDDYDRFFRLLRRADFLTASLMNRFVSEQRLKALQLTNGSASRQGDHVDTELLTRLLCFDDVTQCTSVCTQAGLHCDVAGVHLNGGRQIDTNSVRGLTLSLIRHKSSCELGEVVYGAPLPPFNSRPPSFTSHSDAPPEQEPVSWESAVTEEARECVESVMQSEIEAVVGEVFRSAERNQLISLLSDQLYDQLLAGQSAECVCEIVRQEMLREMEVRRRREQRSEFIARHQLELFHQLLWVEMSEVVECEAATEREHRALVARAVEAVSEETYRKLELEVLEQLLHEEGESAVSEARHRRKERLEKARCELTNRRLRNKWMMWRDAFVLRKKRKDAVRRFPRVPTASIERCQWSLGAIPDMQQLVTPEKLERVSCWLEEARERAERERKQLTTPLSIPTLLGKTLLDSRCPDGGAGCVANWLLVVMVQGEGGVADWLLKVLGSGETEDRGHVCTLSEGETLIEEGLVRVRVWLVGEKCPPSELKGSSAVLLLTNDLNQSEVRNELSLIPLRGVKRRPHVPVCVLHTYTQSPQLSATPSCVGEVRTAQLPATPTLEARTELERSLLWLAAHSAPQPLLACQGFREAVGDRMYALFAKPAAAHAAERERLGVRGPSLSAVSALYSAAISCVRTELTGRRVQELNWPISGDNEMWRWNEETRLREIREAIDWLELERGEEESVEDFLRGCQHLSPTLHADCQALLTRHLKRLKRLGLPLCPPWAHILETVMHARMQSSEFDTSVCFERQSKEEIDLPDEWTRSLEQISNRSVCIGPALRRKMNSQSEVRRLQETENRKRHSEPPTPVWEDTSPQELARKTARLDLERSLSRLEGLVMEEVSCSEHRSADLTSLLQSPIHHTHTLISHSDKMTSSPQSADDTTRLMTSWEEQLRRVEEEVRSLTDP